MPFDNVTDATSVGRLIPEATAAEILKNVPQQSAALSLFRRVPLSTRTARQNVLNALPMAYFVNGDTGYKQTTEMEWRDVVMTVEEIATIIPVPINVIDDASFDLWGEVRPAVEEAFGRVIDAAVFFGTNKPASWPDAIAVKAVAVDNDVNAVTADLSSAGWGPKYADLISDLMSKVEDDGYDVNGFVVPRNMRGRFRKLRDADGNRLADVANSTYEGITFRPAMDGLWPTTGTEDVNIIAGDFTKAVIGMRKDITWELFREGVIQDPNTGNIVFNLLQQDMVAMRVTMRLAFQVANPVNFSNLTANRYPFAVLRHTP